MSSASATAVSSTSKRKAPASANGTPATSKKQHIEKKKNEKKRDLKFPTGVDTHLSRCVDCENISNLEVQTDLCVACYNDEQDRADEFKIKCRVPRCDDDTKMEHYRNGYCANHQVFAKKTPEEMKKLIEPAKSMECYLCKTKISANDTAAVNSKNISQHLCTGCFDKVKRGEVKGEMAGFCACEPEKPTQGCPISWCPRLNCSQHKGLKESKCSSCSGAFWADPSRGTTRCLKCDIFVFNGRQMGPSTPETRRACITGQGICSMCTTKLTAAYPAAVVNPAIGALICGRCRWRVNPGEVTVCPARANESSDDDSSSSDEEEEKKPQQKECISCGFSDSKLDSQGYCPTCSGSEEDEKKATTKKDSRKQRCGSCGVYWKPHELDSRGHCNGCKDSSDSEDEEEKPSPASPDTKEEDSSEGESDSDSSAAEEVEEAPAASKSIAQKNWDSVNHTKVQDLERCVLVENRQKLYRVFLAAPDAKEDKEHVHLARLLEASAIATVKRNAAFDSVMARCPGAFTRCNGKTEFNCDVCVKFIRI